MEKALAAAERLSLLRIKDRNKAIALLADSVRSAECILTFGTNDSAKSVKPLVSLCNEKPWNQHRLLRSDSPINTSTSTASSSSSSSSLNNVPHQVEGYIVTPTWQNKYN